jgi:hypothetical protein
LLCVAWTVGRRTESAGPEEAAMNDEDRIPATTDTHRPVRPLKFFRDAQGNGWLCDKDIDPDRDLRAQGCWRCDEMAFPTGGR